MATNVEMAVVTQIARVLGNNGPPDDRFWFKSGLSLLVANPVSPPAYLEEHERDCVPGTELQLGDVVVYYKGPLSYKRTSNDQQVVATQGLNVLRFGVAYADATDQIRVISQDEQGNVWDHSLEEFPSYQGDDWNFYGLRIPPRVSDTKDPDGNINPPVVIDTWLRQI